MELKQAIKILSLHGINLNSDEEGYFYQTYDLTSDETIKHYISLTNRDVCDVLNINEGELYNLIDEYM